MRSSDVMKAATPHGEHEEEDIADPTPVVMMGLMLFAALCGIGLTLILNWQFGVGVFLLLAIPFWKSSLYEIPATPPTMGILKFMGKPIGVLKDRGLRLVPLKGFLFGYDLIELDVSAQELEINDLVLTTPADGVQTPPVEIAVTWRPDSSSAQALLKFHDYSHGGHPEEINDFLKEIIVERARNYANSPVEGPKTIEELVRCTRGINHAILKTLGADEIPSCSSKVPTEVLMDWMHHPSGPSIASFSELWGEHWERVNEIVEREGKEKVKEEVRERMRLLSKVSSGRGEVRVQWLGIVIEKIAVDEIKEPADLANARLFKKKAKEQNEADKIRLLALRKRLAAFMGVAPDKVQLAREQALSFVASGGKLERWSLDEKRLALDAGSGLAAVLERLGLKVIIESAGSGEKEGGS